MADPRNIKGTTPIYSRVQPRVFETRRAIPYRDRDIYSDYQQWPEATVTNLRPPCAAGGRELASPNSIISQYMGVAPPRRQIGSVLGQRPAYTRYTRTPRLGALTTTSPVTTAAAAVMPVRNTRPTQAVALPPIKATWNTLAEYVQAADGWSRLLDLERVMTIAPTINAVHEYEYLVAAMTLLELEPELAGEPIYEQEVSGLINNIRQLRPTGQARLTAQLTQEHKEDRAEYFEQVGRLLDFTLESETVDTVEVNRLRKIGERLLDTWERYAHQPIYRQLRILVRYIVYLRLLSDPNTLDRLVPAIERLRMEPDLSRPY